ncbi:hypothetical protein BDZ94DRAFT_1242558 [Collybia nuda]|uniref:S-adenosylmethionine-dependent methyltransferase n=1 Tax=Collybia nuda TaxID=64659 RepID=A0A9P6CKF8_9AGAR|nr:hypothetical protein BDZ94DRAFT_1242558 [Collybia nuda]
MIMDKHNPSPIRTFLTPPTGFLPPLSRLSNQSTQDIVHALQKLRNLYWPPPVPAALSLPKRKLVTLIHDDSVPDSGYASAEEDDEPAEAELGIDHSPGDADETLEILRSDSLERAFAIKWVTGFIARADVWASIPTCQDQQNIRTELLDEASSLLSAFIGDEDEDEENYTRSFSFQSEYGPPIEIELNDTMLEGDHTSVGLQSWGSAIVFAEKMCATPNQFSLSSDGAKSLRVLELGAGTGLLSIVAAKILQDTTPLVVATDYHPDVLANLSANVSTNFPTCDPLPVAVRELDWESPSYLPPLDCPFDVILAADVIYHPSHAQWIKGCAERLLARPCADSPKGGTFWMIMALRTTGRHEGLDNTVYDVFPDVSEVPNVGVPVLAVLGKEETRKIDGIGRVDESGYRLFEIGWTGYTL